MLRYCTKPAKPCNLLEKCTCNANGAHLKKYDLKFILREGVMSIIYKLWDISPYMHVNYFLKMIVWSPKIIQGRITLNILPTLLTVYGQLNL